MKREGQFWFGAFGLLLGIPLVMSFCAVMAGKVDEERAKAAAIENGEAVESPIAGVRDRGD